MLTVTLGVPRGQRRDRLSGRRKRNFLGAPPFCRSWRTYVRLGSEVVARPSEDIERVQRLLCIGLSQAEAARQAGVPRGTVRTWITLGTDTVLEARRAGEHAAHHDASDCHHVRCAPETAYAYLLGLYLGDGCLSSTHRPGVFRLRIALDERYEAIIAECQAAMAQVLPNKVGVVQNPGCVTVGSYSRHWPCMFPQHAVGKKHLRSIKLQPWQQVIALDRHPRMLLRGLIESDGYRGINRIRGRYEYPRYTFSNRSDDIRAIFLEACRRVGVNARPNGAWQVCVSRRDDVALMDTFVGPKC